MFIYSEDFYLYIMQLKLKFELTGDLTCLYISGIKFLNCK